MMRRFRIAGVAPIIASLLLAACAGSEPAPKSSRTIADISELVLDPQAAPTRLWKRDGAPTLAAYNRFIVDPVRVLYSDPNSTDLSHSDVRRIRGYMEESLVKELRDGGYEIVTRASPGTMRIALTITGMRTPKGLAVHLPGGTFIPIDGGEVTVEGVFTEAVANRVDAVALARYVGPPGVSGSPWASWDDVKAGLRRWAKGIRKAVDDAHKRG